ncbi:MAG: hypothetical protein E6G44_08895, partial [Actinobacteria bacterium]
MPQKEVDRMRKLSLAVAFATALLAGSAHVAHAHTAATLVVDDDGMGDIASCNNATPTYSTIQAAVNDAVSGDTIKVCPGTYTESVTVSTDNLTLAGAKAGIDARFPRGTGESIVQPSAGLTGVSLNADNLTLDGFRVTLVSGDASGIYTNPSYSGYSVVNNIVDHNTFGLYLNTGASIANLVEHNYFNENNASGAASGNGIYSDQGIQNVSIHENKFKSNDNGAILIGYAGQTTDNVTIDGNSSKNDASLANLFSGTNITISHNKGNGNTGSGIRLEGVDGVLVQQNTIKNAGYSGIAVRDSEYGQDPTNNVTVTRNKVIGAANDGLDVTASTPGVVSADHNTLRSNGNDGIEMDAA